MFNSVEGIKVFCIIFLCFGLKEEEDGKTEREGEEGDRGEQSKARRRRGLLVIELGFSC